MNGLFSKIPESFFSVLSRKYKSVYALALLTLYETLKTYKTKIKKTDYMSLLSSRIDEMLLYFDLKADRLDDKNEDERITALPEEISESSLTVKVSYIVRKLELTGWLEIDKDLKTNTEYIFLPSYSIKMLEFLDNITSDISYYLPLVHQTYSELRLEDEKEDDYMFKAVNNAKRNAEELELSVTLLHHSICVFGHKLTNVYSPNEALHQHFNIYQTEINNKLYHPMKTYDSLGLYALPTIRILTKWQRDDRIINKMVVQARLEPSLAPKSHSEIVSYIVKTIQDTIDIFNKLHLAFDDIDKANANYTEAVQKKVNYLSTNDKTLQGKIKAILVQVAKEIKEDISAEYEDLEFIDKMSYTLSCYRQGYLDFDSLSLPVKRSGKLNEGEPALLDDPFDPSNEGYYDSSLEDEIERYGGEAVDEFMMKNFNGRKIMTTSDINFATMDDFILFILATVRAELELSFYSMERLGDEHITTQGFLLPNYKFLFREDIN